MFGSVSWGDYLRKKQEGREEGEPEIDRLRRELKEAHATIDKLRDALGGNHPLGRSGRNGSIF